MQWSKLKTRVKALLAEDVRNRVDFHVTSYRRSHDEAEKAWITVDGDVVFIASWYKHQYAGFDRNPNGTLRYDGEGYLVRDPHIPPEVTNAEQLELHRPQQFGDALSLYLDLPVDEALVHSDPFIRGLALIDRRVGSRRFMQHKPPVSEHSFVRIMYDLRITTLK